MAQQKSAFSQGFEMGKDIDPRGTSVFDMGQTFASLASAHQAFMTGVIKTHEEKKASNEAANTRLKTVADQVETQLANGTYNDELLESVWMPTLQEYRDRIKNIKGTSAYAEKKRAALFNEMGRFLNGISSGDTNKMTYLKQITNGQHDANAMGTNNLLFTTALAENKAKVRVVNGEIQYSAKITPPGGNEQQFTYTANDGTVYDEWIPEHIVEEIVILKQTENITTAETILTSGAEHASKKGNTFEGWSGDAGERLMNTWNSLDAFRSSINHVYSGNSEVGSYADQYGSVNELTDDIYITLNNLPIDMKNQLDSVNEGTIDALYFATVENFQKLKNILLMKPGTDSRFFPFAKERAKDWHLKQSKNNIYDKNLYTGPGTSTITTFGTSETTAFKTNQTLNVHMTGSISKGTATFKNMQVSPARINNVMALLDSPSGHFTGWDNIRYSWDASEGKWKSHHGNLYSTGFMADMLGLTDLGYVPKFDAGSYKKPK